MQNLFAVFPENPNNSGADGVSPVRASLVKVLKTRAPDAMPGIRYEVKPGGGPCQVRWWQITNTPILGEDGYVQWIINCAADCAGSCRSLAFHAALISTVLPPMRLHQSLGY